MFLEPFTKSSWGLSNKFLITICPVTLVSVDDSTLLLDWVFVYGSHQEVLDGGASFKVHLYPKLSANVLNALTKSTVVWHHYVELLLVIYTDSVCWNLFTVLLLCFYLYPIESPCGVLAILECILQVLLFFLQQLWVGADGLCFVLQYSYHTVFWC